MKVFQLDECLNSKRLEAACRAEGKCVPHRFPKRFKNRSIKDPEVLAEFFALGKAIVTNDAAMLSEHLADIPAAHPGLIIVAFSPDCRDEMTDEASAGILARFKMLMPLWPDLPYENSVLVITERFTEIFHKQGGQLVRDLYAEHTLANLTAAVQAVLERNHARSI
jgi:hypothetical protein